jgi:hypothetical protein
VTLGILEVEEIKIGKYVKPTILSSLFALSTVSTVINITAVESIFF